MTNTCRLSLDSCPRPELRPRSELLDLGFSVCLEELSAWSLLPHGVAEESGDTQGFAPCLLVVTSRVIVGMKEHTRFASAATACFVVDAFKRMLPSL